MTETTSSTTEAPQKTWRDTDTYVWLMLHTGGNEKRVEALRNIFNRGDIATVSNGVFAIHAAASLSQGRGVVATMPNDDFPYGHPTVTAACPSIDSSRGQSTRELTKLFITRQVDPEWRVVFAFDGPDDQELADLHTATRLHGRPVTIICPTLRSPSIRLSASRTLTELAPVLNTTPRPVDTDSEPFFFPPTR